MTHLSVTEIRNALRCPRVFALGRQRGAQVMFPLGASSLGSAFHRIVETFARSAPTPPAGVEALEPGAPQPEVERTLIAWIIDLLVRELELSPTYLTMPAEVDDLAEALRTFVRYVAHAAIRPGTPPAEAIRGFLGEPEVSLELSHTLPDGRSIVIAGRADAIHVHPSGDLQVVEYKLTDEANELIDRAQVALYRHLLRRTEGVEADAVILRFNPALTRTALTGEEADALVESRLLPLLGDMAAWVELPEAAPATERRDLCAVCPLRAPCAETYRDHLPMRDDPPASARRPRPAPTGEIALAAPLIAIDEPARPDDTAGREDGAALQKLVLKVLRESGVAAESSVAPQVGARLVRIEVSAKRGRVTILDRIAREDVIHRLHAHHGRIAQYRRDGGLRSFTIERKDPRAVRLGELIDRAHAELAARPGRFVIGERLDGLPLVGDFADPAACHLLVAGTTGSGKSVLLRSIASSLVHFHPPSAVRLTLVDPKRVSFGKLAPALAAHLASPLCFDVDQALPILRDLVEEMHERYHIFEEARVQDLDELHTVVSEAERLPRHVVLVDEFQDMLASKETRAELTAVVQRLGAKARAAGIHLVLATQRPTKDNVPMAIKANLPGRIALQTTSTGESMVVLDEPGAEELLGKGDLLARLGRGTVRAQGAIG